MGTDCLAATQLLPDDKLGNHELSNIICDCRSMLWMLESEVKHVFRRANFFADASASLNLQQHWLVVFHSMHNFLGQHLYADSIWMKNSLELDLCLDFMQYQFKIPYNHCARSVLEFMLC